MTNSIRRFFGGPPGWVLMRLLVLSLIVGLVLSALDIHPLDIIWRIERLVYGFWNKGFDAVIAAGRWILLGAMIVLPVWFILRLLNMGRRGP